MNNRVLIAVVVLAASGIALGAADYFVKERPQSIAMQQLAGSGSTMPTTIASSAPKATSSSSASSVAAVPVPPDTMPGMSSSSTAFVKKGVSTKKKSGVDVAAVLAALQFIPTETSEVSLLKLSAPNANPDTKVLLMNNDRAALFAWIENDDVKTIFSALKQALQEQFSPKLKDLIDETHPQDNGPPVDVLSFTDPAISPEKVLFLRVRTRLYEFHIAEKSQAAVDQLVAALSQ